MLKRLTGDWLLMLLLLTLPPLIWLAPVPVADLPALVDWKTVAALAGLMALSRGLELSGLLDCAGRWVLGRLRSLRALAVALVLLAAGLAAIVTNDIALFVTVPLTLGLAQIVALPVGRLVIFQALAVNAGSTLSPVGNPQNLFLWQSTGTSLVEFTFAMLPIATAMLALVLALVPLAFARAPLGLQPARPPMALARHLMALCLAAYPLFLLAVNAGYPEAEAAAALVLAGFALGHRRVLRGLDWALLLVLVLIFVNLGLLGRIPAIAAWAEGAMQGTWAAFALGAGMSQLMSNVPATIFLAPFTEEWRALAWGVNIGGFGLAIGSLANLIALRLAPLPGQWREFHIWSVPILLASLLAGAALMALI